MTDDLQALIKQAEILFEAKKYGELITLLPEKVLEKHKSVELYFWLSRAYLRKEEKNQFFIYAERLKAIDRNHWMSFFTEGVIQSQYKDPDKEIACYNKVIELNPNYANAYYHRGCVWYDKKVYDKALADYDKVIELIQDDDKAYIYRGLIWYYKKEYDLALANYSQSIELNPDNVIAYSNRGLVWSAKKEYDLAIADYNKAIALNPNYRDAYNNRGNAWYFKKEYDQAFADYNRVIELYPDYAIGYNNRGLVWSNKKEYDKALTDYDKAIALNPDYADSYNNRGLNFENNKELDKALVDYEKAIQLDENHEYAYRNKARVLNLQGKKAEAITAYGKAVDKFPEQWWTREDLNILLAQEGLSFEYADKRVFSTISMVFQQTEVLPKEDKKKLRQLFVNQIQPAIDAIKTIAKSVAVAWQGLPDDNEPKLVAHYTNLRIADLLISVNDQPDKDDPKPVSDKAPSKMRYSNAVFMNDPDEGRLFIEAVNDLEEADHKGKGEIKSAFLKMNQAQSHFYLGSFMPANQGHEDELVMWRTYGKDHLQNEAAGCCLVFDSDFFDNHRDGKNSFQSAEKSEEPLADEHPLYRVLYYDKRKKVFIGEDADAIMEAVKELKNALRKMLRFKTKSTEEVYKTELQQIIHLIVHHALSEVRFFFKSADYAYENEVRVVVFNAQTAKIGTEDILPRRMYIESTKNMKPYLRKIITGPKLPHPDRWMYLEERMRRDYPQNGFQMIRSECNFQ